MVCTLPNWNHIQSKENEFIYTVYLVADLLPITYWTTHKTSNPLQHFHKQHSCQKATAITTVHFPCTSSWQEVSTSDVFCTAIAQPKETLSFDNKRLGTALLLYYLLAWVTHDQSRHY